MHEKNKIVFVTPWYGDFAGGAEAATRGFAEALVRRGIEVEVLTTCCKSPYDDWWADYYKPGEYQCNNVLVHRFPVDRDGKEQYQNAVRKHISGEILTADEQGDFFIYGINSTSLIDYAMKLPTDHFLVALPYFHALTHSIVVRLPGRVFLMPCFHDEPQFLWKPIRHLLSSARRLLFLSEEEKTLAIRYYGLDFKKRLIESPVVGVGVIEIGEYIFSNIFKNNDDQEQKQRLRQKYNLPEKFFLYVGRKEVGKGVPQLVKWFQLYLKRYRLKWGNSCSLVFIGGGDNSLVPQAPDFLDLGWISEAEKMTLLKMTIGLINLSQNESFSLVVMEAWLCGTPVVVSSQGTVTTGHCVRSWGGESVKDAKEFCKALHLLQTDMTVRNKFGNLGKQYVIMNYNWDTVLEVFLHALEIKINCESSVVKI